MPGILLYLPRLLVPLSRDRIQDTYRMLMRQLAILLDLSSLSHGSRKTPLHVTDVAHH